MENKILIAVFISMIIAQVYKVISALIKAKEINIKRVIESGGMPSSHSATVTALCTGTAIKEGINSTEFAIAVVLAVIVMYDAVGVRRAAGNQAAVINKIIKNLWSKDGEKIESGNLRELLGHTPVEVIAGSIMGVLIAFFIVK